MKRFLVALLAVACLGIGVGIAQNINKALQLSQDSTGAFGVDNVNSVFFPNHIVGNAQLTPTITTGAGTAATITGMDSNGIVTGGGVTTTTVTGTWRSAYGVKPSCVAQSENPATSPLAFVPSTTGFTVSAMGAAIMHYVCVGIRQ